MQITSTSASLERRKPEPVLGNIAGKVDGPSLATAASGLQRTTVTGKQTYQNTFISNIMVTGPAHTGAKFLPFFHYHCKNSHEECVIYGSKLWFYM